jgi:hypothetical protein
MVIMFEYATSEELSLTSNSNNHVPVTERIPVDTVEVERSLGFTAKELPRSIKD